MQANSQTEKKGQAEIPDPVFYAPIKFMDGETPVSYTDCWEISVLRFLHLLFGKDGNIIQERLTKFMDLNNKNCQNLIHYFSINPTYEMKEDFYKTEEGFIIRAKWGQFLNKCGLLDLKLEGKYEVKATVPNLLRFFKEYVTAFTYLSVMSGQIFKQYEEILTQIFSQLSFDHKISCTTEINFDDNEGIMLEYWLIINIFVDSQHRLDWGINQFYNLNGENLGTRIGGHSDYRYH